MTEITVAQLQTNLNLAFDMIANLASNGTRMSEIQAKSHENLASQIETARGETIIVLKVVAQLIARDCLQDRDPRKRLEAFVAPLVSAADVFAPDPDAEDHRAILREAGLPEPTAEELEEERKGAAISQTYTAYAEAIHKEAMRYITGAKR